MTKPISLIHVKNFPRKNFLTSLFLIWRIHSYRKKFWKNSIEDKVLSAYKKILKKKNEIDKKTLFSSTKKILEKNEIDRVTYFKLKKKFWKKNEIDKKPWGIKTPPLIYFNGERGSGEGYVNPSLYSLIFVKLCNYTLIHKIQQPFPFHIHYHLTLNGILSYLLFHFRMKCIS